MFSWTSPYLINYDDLVRWELLPPFKMGKLRLRKGVLILVRPDQVCNSLIVTRRCFLT